MKKSHPHKNHVGVMLLCAIVAYVVLAAVVTDLVPYSKCRAYDNGGKSTYCDKPDYTPVGNAIVYTGLASVIIVFLLGLKIARSETPKSANKPLKKVAVKRRKK
ncbi:MAG: hypothetical protein M3Q14_01340 [bacterium]|nr:hypothetical protein [bacterium]